MTTISNNGNLSWSVSDTVNFSVEAEDQFIAGDQLTFEVAENQENAVIVSQTFQLTGDKFIVDLPSSERAKLPVGTYVYRMILSHADGKVVTEQSGVLYVKWGA